MSPGTAFHVLTCAFAVASLPGGSTVSGADAGLSEKIDAIMAPVAGQDLPGAAVVVLQDGEVVHNRAYGLANVELGVPNTTRTRFRLGSVTKSFTALTVMQLVEQERLRIDDVLERYLPGFSGGDRITIHHLLTHTAGLPDFMPLDEAGKLPRDSAPGERLNYSNIGYSALSRVIEKVTGKSYEENLREAILAPLGMGDTGVDRRKVIEKGRASGYLFAPGAGIVNAEYTDMDADPAAGGLHSTAEDMTRWVKALLTHRIVTAATLEKAMTPVTLAGGRKGAYGYGFMTIPYRGLREVGHGGDISGFNSYVAVYPDERLAVIVLSNVGMQPPGPLPTAATIVHRIVEVLVGERLGPEWPAVAALTPALLQRYAGRYRLEVPGPVAQVMGDSIDITVEGGRVFASGKQGRAEIFPESETTFFSKEGPVRITFAPGTEDAPMEGVLSLLGLREFRLTRVP